MSDELDTGAVPEGQVQEQQAQTQVDTAQADPFETTARAGGWVPQEEWRGPADKWKPAKQFVEDGDRYAGLLKKERDQLRQEREALAATVESQKKFIDFQKKQLDARTEELKAQRREAIQLADTETVDRIDAQIEAVREQKESLPDVQTQKEVRPSPELLDWAQRNASWFEKDSDKTMAAVAIAKHIRDENPQISEGAFVQLLDARLGKLGFTQAAPSGGGLDAGGGMGNGAAAASAGKDSIVVDGKRVTYASLDAEAKQACENFIAQGLIKDRTEYLKMYHGV